MIHDNKQYKQKNNSIKERPIVKKINDLLKIGFKNHFVKKYTFSP